MANGSTPLVLPCVSMLDALCFGQAASLLWTSSSSSSIPHQPAGCQQDQWLDPVSAGHVEGGPCLAALQTVTVVLLLLCHQDPWETAQLLGTLKEREPILPPPLWWCQPSQDLLEMKATTNAKTDRSQTPRQLMASYCEQRMSARKSCRCKRTIRPDEYDFICNKRTRHESGTCESS